VSDVHRTAAIGFDKAAKEYERARPGYPDAAVDWMVDRLHPGSGLVVDLAAGTGKMTRALVSRGLNIVAVEPVEGMRAQLGEALPGVRPLDGTAEHIPLEDGSAAAVVVAQAFHWFRHDEALREIHRVLRAHGRLAIVWNVRDERTDWVARVTKIIEPYEGTGGVRIPRYKTGEWRRAFETTTLFRLADETTVEHPQTMDAQGLVERVASTSFIAALPDDKRAAVEEEVRDLSRTHPDLAGRETFEFPYLTEVYVYQAL